jgi:hypothetical protein
MSCNEEPVRERCLLSGQAMEVFQVEESYWPEILLKRTLKAMDYQE